jgi:hypothetical protein
LKNESKETGDRKAKKKETTVKRGQHRAHLLLLL